MTRFIVLTAYTQRVEGTFCPFCIYRETTSLSKVCVGAVVRLVSRAIRLGEQVAAVVATRNSINELLVLTGSPRTHDIIGITPEKVPLSSFLLLLQQEKKDRLYDSFVYPLAPELIRGPSYKVQIVAQMQAIWISAKRASNMFSHNIDGGTHAAYWKRN